MLLDRPPRVQGRLCNVRPLSEDDFDLSSDVEIEAPGRILPEADLFAIHAVQLARIGMSNPSHPAIYFASCSMLRLSPVDQFYTIKFDETSAQSQDVCLEQISRWASSLPADFQNITADSSPWAMITNILYQ